MIINSLPTALQSAEWNVATYTFTTTGASSSMTFTSVIAEPKQWCLFGAMSSSYFTLSSSNKIVTGIYCDGTNTTHGYAVMTSYAVGFDRSTSSVTTGYNSSTQSFSITLTDRYFARGRSSYYYTYYLFYTV